MSIIKDTLKSVSKAVLKTALAGAVVMGAGYLVLNAPQLHHNYILGKVGSSVVKITNTAANSGGTGFAVQSASGKNYILTNAHICVGVQKPLIVTFNDNRQVPLRIIEVSRKTDLCIIESVGNLPALSLAWDLDIGDQVGIVGHPALMSMTLTKGDLIQYMEAAFPVDFEFCNRAKEMGGPFFETPNPFYPCIGYIRKAGQTTAVILGGNSGSPAVNFFGNVVGVAFAGRADDGSNWGLIIPLDEVKAFLKPY